MPHGHCHPVHIRRKGVCHNIDSHKYLAEAPTASVQDKHPLPAHRIQNLVPIPSHGPREFPAPAKRDNVVTCPFRKMWELGSCLPPSCCIARTSPTFRRDDASVTGAAWSCAFAPHCDNLVTFEGFLYPPGPPYYTPQGDPCQSACQSAWHRPPPSTQVCKPHSSRSPNTSATGTAGAAPEPKPHP